MYTQVNHNTKLQKSCIFYAPNKNSTQLKSKITLYKCILVYCNINALLVLINLRSCYSIKDKLFFGFQALT